MPRITELYAFICADTDEDDEGVPGFDVPGPDGKRLLMPMMGADVQRAESLVRWAQAAADQRQKPVRMVVSTGLRVVKTLQPKAPQTAASAAPDKSLS